MWRYWVSDGCFYTLIALAVIGCGALLRITTLLHPALIIALAAAIVFAINTLGQRVTRDIP